MKLVLFSGGVDSSVLVARAHRTRRLAGVLFVAYGQPAALQEWRAARAVLGAIGAEAAWHELLLDMACDDMRARPGEAGPRVVPARNLVFLAHGVNLASALGAGTVEYGATSDDWSDYPDCRPAFVSSLNAALRAPDRVSGFDGWPRVSAPLIHSRKELILQEAQYLGILKHTWSCYAPRDGHPCSTCDACQARRLGDYP